MRLSKSFRPKKKSSLKVGSVRTAIAAKWALSSSTTAPALRICSLFIMPIWRISTPSPTITWVPRWKWRAYWSSPPKWSNRSSFKSKKSNFLAMWRTIIRYRRKRSPSSSFATRLISVRGPTPLTLFIVFVPSSRWASTLTSRIMDSFMSIRQKSPRTTPKALVRFSPWLPMPKIRSMISMAAVLVWPFQVSSTSRLSLLPSRMSTPLARRLEPRRATLRDTPVNSGWLNRNFASLTLMMIWTASKIQSSSASIGFLRSAPKRWTSLRSGLLLAL